MTRYVTEQVVSERIAVRGGDMLVQVAAYDDVSLTDVARTAGQTNFLPFLLVQRWKTILARCRLRCTAVATTFFFSFVGRVLFFLFYMVGTSGVATGSA